MSDVIEAYKLFDKRTPGWVKVMLEPSVETRAA
jgi:threonine dehydrogenase-like Zn-dependent dehydrogenase